MESIGFGVELILIESARLESVLKPVCFISGLNRLRSGFDLDRGCSARVGIGTDLFHNGIDRVRCGIDLDREGSVSVSIETGLLQNGIDRLRYVIDLEREGSA